MKKKGFTLAEALVALAVVGVVAAITIPQIAIGVQKKQAGAMLAKAYAQIEQGMQNYVQAYNDTSADGSFVEKWINIPSRDVKTLMTYSGAKHVEEMSDYVSIKKVANSIYSSGIKGDKFRFNKLPVEFITKIKGVVIKMGGEIISENDYSVTVDINGFDKKPNAYGSDVFEFTLNRKGYIEPTGKEDWREKCGSTITDGKSCTARVVAEGWKITY